MSERRKHEKAKKKDKKEETWMDCHLPDDSHVPAAYRMQPCSGSDRSGNRLPIGRLLWTRRTLTIFLSMPMICDAGVDRDGQYWEYLYGQRFYEFAKELRVRLDTDPDVMKEIGEKLRSVQKSILHRDRMAVMNVAPPRARRSRFRTFPVRC